MYRTSAQQYRLSRATALHAQASNDTRHRDAACDTGFHRPHPRRDSGARCRSFGRSRRDEVPVTTVIQYATERKPGKCIPALIEEVTMTQWVGRPNDLRHEVQHLP